ncbi:MAG: tetratricopeptide repeat protein [Desulfobacterales bacterium]|nr:tetratricopeptide repeat protein [Desulfobacterales bacterium]
MICLALAGCAGKVIFTPTPSEPDVKPVIESESGKVPNSPQVVAAIQLLEQGKRYIHDGKPDEAIRILERAISLHPSNGENYFYLADAWIIKQSAEQAKEYHLMANRYLNHDPAWESGLRLQFERIQKMVTQ